MERMGISLTRDKYDLIYVGEWTPDLDLEKIFTRFNIDRPDDFKGHSLSMSDVVLVHENGENRAYYVDTIGFAELPDFFRNQVEQKSIDGERRPGSVRARLKEKQETVARAKAQKPEKEKTKTRKKPDVREP